MLHQKIIINRSASRVIASCLIDSLKYSRFLALVDITVTFSILQKKVKDNEYTSYKNDSKLAKMKIDVSYIKNNY